MKPIDRDYTALLKELLTTVAWGVGNKVCKVSMVNSDEIYIEGLGKFNNQCFNVILSKPQQVEYATDNIMNWANGIDLKENFY